MNSSSFSRLTNFAAKFRCLLLTFGLLIAGNAFAGTMEKVGNLDMPPDSHPNASVGCSHRFTGTVQAGDLSKFKFDMKNQTITVICLNSPGGSFAEAVKIAAYLKEKTIGTKLEAEATCESACSLIFMAGSYYAHEVGALHWRIMHPTAKLGFHAPSLNVEAGTYDEKTVGKAYKLAMQSMSEIIFKLIQKQGFQGGYSMKPALLGHMVSTPPQSMFYIDTVDKAGRWEIMVGPTTHIDDISDDQFYLACQNFKKWERDESAIGAGGIPDSTVWVKRGKGDGFATSINVIVDEFNGTDCTFKSNEKTISTRTGISGEAIPHYIGTYMLPETKLALLRPTAKIDAASQPTNSVNCSVRKNSKLIDSNVCRVQIDSTEPGKKVMLFFLAIWRQNRTG